MGQRTSGPRFSDSIDELFDPVLSDAIEDQLAADEPKVQGGNRLAELRRRAEQRLEEKRMREELDYMDPDWNDD